MGTLEDTSSELMAVADALVVVAPAVPTHQLESLRLRNTDDAQATSVHQMIASRSDPRATHREDQRRLRREMRQNGADFYTERLKERRQEARAKRKSGRQSASRELEGSQKRGRSIDATKLLKQIDDVTTDESKAQMMQFLGGMKPKKAKKMTSPSIVGGGHLCIANAVPEPTRVTSIQGLESRLWRLPLYSP